MTNNTQSAELMTALAELAQHYPHWRFGQLVDNVAGWADKATWDVEDAELLAAAREHLERRASDLVDASSPDCAVAVRVGPQPLTA